MKVLSVNVGMPSPMEWRGREFLSGIRKTPIGGRAMARATNLDGDGQADLANHGGPSKAVYAYPVEHYPYWREWLGEDLPMGGLGENLTIEGLTESVRIGDRLTVGGAILVVTHPREPCFKLAALHRREEIVAAFLRSGRCGFYLSVEREGTIGAGDEIRVLSRDPREVSVAAVFDVLRGEPVAEEVLRRALELEMLPPYWKGKVRRRCEAVLPENSPSP